MNLGNWRGQVNIKFYPNFNMSGFMTEHDCFSFFIDQLLLSAELAIKHCHTQRTSEFHPASLQLGSPKQGSPTRPNQHI